MLNQKVAETLLHQRLGQITIATTINQGVKHVDRGVAIGTLDAGQRKALTTTLLY